MNNLYKRIMEKANEKGLSAYALCQEAGVTRSRMSDLKSGKVKSLSTETLRRFALVLNTTVEELLYGVEGTDVMRILPGEKPINYKDLCARLDSGDLLSLLNAATLELQRRQSSAEKE